MAALAGAGVLLFVVIVLIRWPAKFTELPIGKIAATVFMLTLYGVCFASIAYGIGAYTGRRAISLGGGRGGLRGSRCVAVSPPRPELGSIRCQHSRSAARVAHLCLEG